MTKNRAINQKRAATRNCWKLEAKQFLLLFLFFLQPTSSVYTGMSACTRVRCVCIYTYSMCCYALYTAYIEPPWAFLYTRARVFCTERHRAALLRNPPVRRARTAGLSLWGPPGSLARTRPLLADSMGVWGTAGYKVYSIWSLRERKKLDYTGQSLIMKLNFLDFFFCLVKCNRRVL